MVTNEETVVRPSTVAHAMKRRVIPRTDSFAAYAMALADMEAPKHDAENPHFHSKFASLAECQRVACEAFEKHGLALVYRTEYSPEAGTSLECRVIHVANVDTVASASFPVAQPGERNPQEVGKGLTYARRYLLHVLARLVAEGDDDGNAASGAAPVASRAQAPSRTAKPASAAAPAASQNGQLSYRAKCLIALGNACDDLARAQGKKASLIYNGKFSVFGRICAEKGIAKGNYSIAQLEDMGILDSVEGLYRWKAKQDGLDPDAEIRKAGVFPDASPDDGADGYMDSLAEEEVRDELPF